MRRRGVYHVLLYGNLLFLQVRAPGSGADAPGKYTVGATA